MDSYFEVRARFAAAGAAVNLPTFDAGMQIARNGAAVALALAVVPGYEIMQTEHMSSDDVRVCFCWLQ